MSKILSGRARDNFAEDRHRLSEAATLNQRRGIADRKLRIRRLEFQRAIVIVLD